MCSTVSINQKVPFGSPHNIQEQESKQIVSIGRKRDTERMKEIAERRPLDQNLDEIWQRFVLTLTRNRFPTNQKNHQ